MIHLYAVIFHVNQCGVGIELEGLYGRVAEEFHSCIRKESVGALRVCFSLNSYGYWRFLKYWLILRL